MPEDLRAVVRQRGSEGAGPAASRARTHTAHDAVHGISLAGAPGETGQLPDRTSREVTADHGERSVQAGGEVEVTAGDGGGGAERRVVHGYGLGAGQSARRDARETALCRCRRVLKPADRVRGRRCCHRGSGAGKQCRRSGQDRDHPSMPAHDLPYFEPAGGQNAEASSVVKAFSLGSIAGDSLAGGIPLRAEHHRRVVTRHSGRGPDASLPGPVAPAPAARCAEPAAARPRSGVNGPSGLGPVRLGLMSDRAVTGAGPSGTRFPPLPRARDLTGRPGRRRSCRHGRREWLAGRSVPRCG